MTHSHPCFIPLLTLLLALSAVPARAGDDAERKTFDTAKWRPTIDAFKARDAESPPPADAVLFVGSSTIRIWKTAELFPGIATINRGFGGSNIPAVLAYLDEIVLPYAPRTIVFYSGDNDITAGQPPKYVAADFQAFADQVLEKLPETRILLIAIKPSVKRHHLWPRMREANRRMAEICADDTRLTYLDLADTLLNEDGEPNPEAFYDGLHLTEATYGVWSARVREELAAIDAARAEAAE